MLWICRIATFPQNLALHNSLDGFWENAFYERTTDACTMALALLTQSSRAKKLKILWRFEILTYGSQWENPKMWNILKMADRGAKGWKFGTQGTTVHICRVFLMRDSLSLVWGHLVHFATFLILRFSKLATSTPLPISSDFNQTLL